MCGNVWCKKGGKLSRNSYFLRDFCWISRVLARRQSADHQGLHRVPRWWAHWKGGVKNWRHWNRKKLRKSSWYNYRWVKPSHWLQLHGSWWVMLPFRPHVLYFLCAGFQNGYIHILDWTSRNQIYCSLKYILVVSCTVNLQNPVQVCGPLKVCGFVWGQTKRSREAYKLDTVSIWAYNWASSWVTLDISW